MSLRLYFVSLSRHQVRITTMLFPLHSLPSSWFLSPVIVRFTGGFLEIAGRLPMRPGFLSRQITTPHPIRSLSLYHSLSQYRPIS